MIIPIYAAYTCGRTALFKIINVSLIHTWSDKVFKGTVVNRTLPSLHGGSIMFTVPLMRQSVQRLLAINAQFTS